jgi:hypothetical protein
VVAGRRLVLRNPSAGADSALHLARDAGMTVGNAGGAGDPQCTGAGGGGASSVRITAAGGAGEVLIPLPCAGWTTNATNTRYRYRDPSGATCRLVIVRHHVMLKAVCKGPQAGLALQAGMAPVSVMTTLNTERYCAEFGGTIARDGSDGRSFLAHDAAAPSSCPTTTTSSSSTSTSTSSTTPTTLAFCCAFTDRCVFSSPSQPAELCEQAGGTVFPDFGCDGGTGGCVAGAGAPGPCCQRTYIVPHQVGCEAGPAVNAGSCVTGGNWIAAFYPSATCAPSGACVP